MKTFAFVVETVRTDQDDHVVTLLRTLQGNVIDTCPMECVGTSISKFIASLNDEKK